MKGVRTIKIWTKSRIGEARTGLLLAAPFLLGFIIFYIAPFFISLYDTFVSGSGNVFVGFANYADVFQSRAFQIAAWNTFRFIIFGVPLIMAVSLILSLLLFRKFKGASFFRSVFLYPLVVPIASTVMVVQVLFSDGGIVNTVLGSMKIPQPSWLDSKYAFFVLLGIYVWKNCGYNIVLFLAGLNSIPQDFYGVASLEGANRLQSFRYITLPLLIPDLFFIFIISIINSFKSFREAYLIGGSMPNKSIYMLQHFMNNNFQNLNYQRLSVAALLVFLVIFALIFLLFHLKRKVVDWNT